MARGEPLPQFDLHARLLTLPGIFDSTPDSVPASVPYLHVDDAREERVGRVVERALERDAGTRRHGDAEKEDGPEDDAPAFVAASPRPGVPASAPPLPASPRHRVPASSRPTLRVGLVWQGNTAHKGDRQRSIALARFAPLAQVPGVRLVSLQKGFGSEQVAACNDEVPVVEWSDPADTTAEALLDTAVAPEPAELLPA